MGMELGRMIETNRVVGEGERECRFHINTLRDGIHTPVIICHDQ